MSDFNRSELERLVAVETKLETVIEQNKELKDLLTSVLTSYVPRNEYETDIKGLNKKIEDAKRKAALQNWVTGSLSAGFGSVLTFLIIEYLKK